MTSRKVHRHRDAAWPAQPVTDELGQATWLIQRRRWTEARTLLQSLAQRYPRRVDVLTALVNVSYELRDTREYQHAAERLLELTPDNPDLNLGLAGAYMKNIRPALALRTFRRFLERWPDHQRAAEVRTTVADLETQLSVVLPELGLFGEEGTALAALHEQVQSLLEQGGYRQALEVAAELLRRRPNFVPTLNNVSQLHALEGRHDQAIATAQRALACDPQNHHALSNLTHYLCLTGRLAEAHQLSAQLKAVESERVDVWTKKAEALSYLGDDQGVLEAFAGAERAGLVRPPLGDPLLLHLAAVAALRLGREDEARRHWRHALRWAPGFDLARANLDDLRRPVGERHAPWPFTFANWVVPKVVQGLAAQLQAFVRAGKDQAVERAVRRYLSQHPELPALIPLLLDRGDPQAREFALRTALIAETPDLLAALRDFALGQRGPDLLRQQAAQAAIAGGLVPPGPVRLWAQGQWRELLVFSFEIDGEPVTRHPPHVQRWQAEAMAALKAGDPRRAEPLFQRALELEPDAPDLLYNLATAQRLQGREQEAELIIRRLHQDKPDYLFARVALARLAIQRDRLDEAKALLEPLLTPRRLHPSEFAALCDAQIELCLAEGNRDAADSWLNLWAQADAGNPLLRQRRQQLRRRRWRPDHQGSDLRWGP